MATGAKDVVGLEAMLLGSLKGSRAGSWLKGGSCCSVKRGCCCCCCCCSRSCCLAAMDDDAAAGVKVAEPDGRRCNGEIGMV